MTDDQIKRLAFNAAFERTAESRAVSPQARAFLQWRIQKNREMTAIDKYVEHIVREAAPKPRWLARLFGGRS